MDTLKGKNVTLGMLFNAALLLTLKEYNGSDKVQVQWIYNARDEKWKQNMVGLTMSALPIAIDFSRPGLDLLKEIRMQIAENIAWSDLSFALYDNSPGLQENLNIILEEGMVEDAAITPGTRDINLWGCRHTTRRRWNAYSFLCRKKTGCTCLSITTGAVTKRLPCSDFAKMWLTACAV